MSMNDLDALVEALESLKQLKMQKYTPLTQQQADQYNRELLHWLDKIESLNDQILTEMTLPTPTSLDAARRSQEEMSVPHPSKEVYVSAAKRKKYLHHMGVGDEVLRRLEKKPISKKKQIELDYTVYRANLYGRIANKLFHQTAAKLTKEHPHFFNALHASIRRADIKVLANTYVSMIFLTTMVFAIIGGISGFVIGAFIAQSIIFSTVLSCTLAVLFSIVMFFIWYLYPTTVVSSRNRMMKNDLPFAIIHMAAIAGSGTQPAAMFRLLLNAGEYRGLESDLKKIVNYINLFGYDLSTALKSVSATTPSKRFKDVLNGIAATIESGGSLKSYLKSIADDTMNTYRLDRKKHIEVISTYSDIYTGILIAAPLLFLVTLAIINTLGGGIGGLSVASIAVVGTYIGIPVLNIAFILFMKIVQSD